MDNEFLKLSNTQSWRTLVDVSRESVKKAGYELERQPGRGRSNVYMVKKGGKEQLASIRTTKDRWIAFPPLKDKWKTLDDVELVIISAVDDVEDPKNAEVYILPADEVRDRFNASYRARISSGQKVRENFGMWVCLDRDDRGIAASVGSGIIESHTPVAVIPLVDLGGGDDGGGDPDVVEESSPKTIASILASAKQHIARIADVSTDQIQLDLRIEH